ncbi:GNAT family N-acetyltransferase [Flavobacterium sp.]
MNLILETDRLLFRPLEIIDADAMFAMDSNPEVHKYLWQKPIQNIEETIKNIESVQSQYVKNNIGRYATVLKETAEFIGWTGIKFVNDHIENGHTNFYDYGYRLNEKFWNNGYATEATRFWLEYGFKQLNINIINAYTHADNAASNSILRKCGMSFIEDYQDDDGSKWKWWQVEFNHFKT